MEGHIRTPDEGPVIIGHRGAAGHAPENTEASFAAALELGVDAIELDVQFTSDGEPVVFHDETLSRMAGVEASIHANSESVLRGFDIGFLHGDEYRGQRIPAVADIATMIPDDMELHVELKDYQPVEKNDLRRLMDVLTEHGGLSRVIVSSPHEDVLSMVREHRAEVRLALLLFRDVKVPTDAARRAALLGCEAVNPNHVLIDSELVAVCHRHNMKVNAFTVNERGIMRKLNQMGVDGFFTDYPDKLRGVVS